MVAAEAIAKIAQLVRERSVLTIEELQVAGSDEGPIMPEENIVSSIDMHDNQQPSSV